MVAPWYQRHAVLPPPMVVLCVLLMVAGCVSEQTDDMQFLQKPFDRRYQNNSPFDHDLPTFAQEDGNATLLTWRGEALLLGWDEHDGHDWGLPEGTPVLAAAAGEVVFVGSDNFGALAVIVQHVLANGAVFETLYLHLSRIDVVQGQRVNTGQQMALSGNTGFSSGPHLHFGVYRLTGTNNGRRTPVDPFGWQGEGPDPWAQHADGAESVWLWKDGWAPSGDFRQR